MKLPPSPAPWRPHPNLAVWLLLTLALASSGCGSGHQRTHPLSSLSEQDREMLRQYEAIRVSLARDDARSAKRTAAGFQGGGAAPAAAANSPAGDAVSKIAATAVLETQREAFRNWSAYAIALTREVEGFYVIHCPLPGCGDWLQTDAKVDNPYMGKSMHDCGEVQK